MSGISLKFTFSVWDMFLKSSTVGVCEIQMELSISIKDSVLIQTYKSYTGAMPPESTWIAVACAWEWVGMLSSPLLANTPLASSCMLLLS